MTDPACAEPPDAPHAWDRSRWAWHLFLPALLAAGLASTLADDTTSGRQDALAALGCAAMIGWYWWMRPDRARSSTDQRRSLVWGVGTVLMWLPLVLVHPAFFIVLAGLFSTVFANVDLGPATWLAALLGLEIVIAELRYGDRGVVDILVTVGWVGSIVVLAVVFARWIHGIIDQSRERSDLIARLETAQADLAAAERQAGVVQERARLAGEIHDTLAQGFTSLVVLLQAVEASLPPGATPERAQVELAIETARENLAEARRLIADASPGQLDGSTLPDAVARVGERFAAETGVSVATTVVGDHRVLPSTVEVALLRATQEALANVRKHAGATAVTIVLDYHGEVSLQVADDGVGFDPAVATDGFGLRGMRDRMASVEGRVAVASEPGHGTRVLVEVP